MQSFQQRLEETVADLAEAQEMSIILLAEAIEDGKCQFSRGWRGQKQSFQQRLEETVADLAEAQGDEEYHSCSRGQRRW